MQIPLRRLSICARSNFTLAGTEEARFPFEENRRELFYLWFVYCFEYGELLSQHLHDGIQSARWRRGDWRPRALRHRSVHRCRHFLHVCYFKYWCICKRYICISFAFPVAVAVLFSSFPLIVNSSILGERKLQRIRFLCFPLYSFSQLTLKCDFIKCRIFNM